MVPDQVCPFCLGVSVHVDEGCKGIVLDRAIAAPFEPGVTGVTVNDEGSISVQKAN